jgi:hypothetical protein
MHRNKTIQKQDNNQFDYLKVGVLYSKSRNFIRDSLDYELGDMSKFSIGLSSFPPALFTHIGSRC